MKSMILALCALVILPSVGIADTTADQERASYQSAPASLIPADLKPISVEKVIDDSDRTRWNGGVKEVTVGKSSFSERFGDLVEGESVPDRRYSYDPHGNLLSVTAFDGKIINTGEPIEKTITCSYDEKGNRSSANVDDVFPDFDMTIKYGYDAKGLRTDRTSYTADGKLINKTRYAYNAGDKPTETLLCNKDGQLEQKTVDTYKKSGKLEKSERYDSNGKKISYRLYEYDGNGRLETESIYRIEEEWFPAVRKVDTLVGKHTVQYESSGRMKEEVDSFVPAGLDSGLSRMGGYEIRRAYTYDKVGNLSSTVYSMLVSEFGEAKWKPSVAYHYKLTLYAETERKPG